MRSMALPEVGEANWWMLVRTDCHGCEAAGVPCAGAVWAMHVERSAVVAGGLYSRCSSLLTAYGCSQREFNFGQDS